MVEMKGDKAYTQNPDQSSAEGARDRLASEAQSEVNLPAGYATLPLLPRDGSIGPVGLVRGANGLPLGFPEVSVVGEPPAVYVPEAQPRGPGSGLIIENVTAPPLDSTSTVVPTDVPAANSAAQGETPKPKPSAH